MLPCETNKCEYGEFYNKLCDIMTSNFLFTKDHGWVKIEDNVATFGITGFARSEIGDVVFVDILDSIFNYQQGDVFGTIETVKTVSDLFIPLSGKIIEINPSIKKQPRIINEDSYNSGWIIKIYIENLSEIDNLLSYKEYKELLNEN